MATGPDPDRRIERNLVRAIAALAQAGSLLVLLLSILAIGFTCFGDTTTCELSDESRSRLSFLALGLCIVAMLVLWRIRRRLARAEQGDVGWMVLATIVTLGLQFGAIYIPLMVISS